MAFPTQLRKDDTPYDIDVVKHTTTQELLTHDDQNIIPRLEDISDLDSAIHKLALLMWITDIFRNKISPKSQKSPTIPTMVITKGRDLARKYTYRLKAETFYIKQMQEKYFPMELANLLAHKKDKMARIPISSPLVGLAPFLDEQGVMRVGGRVQSAPLTYDQKHPIIVHHKSILAQRIVAKYHDPKKHAHAPTTISHIRSKFHILRVRTLVQKFIYQCIPCQEINRQPAKQMLGPFRPERFLVGTKDHTLLIDYSGHLLIRQLPDAQGNSNLIKAYIIIYMQMNTRFIYLDIV